MNKFLTVFLVFVFSWSMLQGQGGDPVLFTIGDDEVKVSEFKYIYEKNNRENADYSEASLEEYYDLYKKFKLKVQKAKAMKLDTVPALIAELAGYRRQLAKSYLVDNEVSENLVKEVYERQQKDRKIAHIFFSVDKYAPERTVAKVEDKALDIYDLLKKGSTFEQVCKDVSEDKATAKKGGVLGYFAAPMPDGFYEIESAIANMKPGDFSKPVRSRLGIHIVKLVEDRAARGEMEFAHILIKKTIKGQTLMNARRLADSVYVMLNRGAEFNEVVLKHSQDKKTSKKNGYLGYSGIGKYEPSFEDAAFALKKDGDYTNVVESKIGYHIIKRISKRDDANYNIAKKRIKSKILKTSRFEKAKKNLIERIKSDANFKLNEGVLDSFTNALDNKFYSYAWRPKQVNDELLLSFGDKDQYSLRDFASYCQSNGSVRVKFSKKKPKKEAIDELLSKFVDEKAIVFEEKNLEKKYPDFKSLMREYEEGILLFEATKINVWDKAAKDSTGLKAFYSRNSAHYVWDPRAELEEILIATDDKRVVKKVYKYAKKSSRKFEKIEAKFNKKATIVEMNDKIVEINAKDVIGMEWQEGGRSPLNVDKRNKRASFKRIVKMLPSKIKTLDEAKGYVIADYQDELEKKWLKSLRHEFDVKLDENVFKSLIK